MTEWRKNKAYLFVFLFN